MERIRIETLRKLQNPTRSDSSTDNGHHSTPTNSMTTSLEQSQAQLTKKIYFCPKDSSIQNNVFCGDLQEGKEITIH